MKTHCAFSAIFLAAVGVSGVARGCAQNPAAPALSQSHPSDGETVAKMAREGGGSIGPAFEVVTVRLNPNADPNQGHWSLPGTGVFNASGLSLTWLVRLAYNVDPSQIPNRPAWMDSDLFDVAAKPEAGVALSSEELRPRLQNLLAQRFHLVVHRETRMEPGYALVVAKDGAKLQTGQADGRANFRHGVYRGHVEGTNWDMAFLAQMLTPFAGFPVVDETGLKGNYDVKVLYAPDTDVESSLPSLLAAIRETLGLELRSKKVPVETIVIDHVDRIPTEN